MNKRYFICLILFLVFSASKYTIAQGQLKQSKADKDIFLLDGNISLDSLTKVVHKRSAIRFSFNSVKVKGSKEINFKKSRYSIQEILQQIRKTTSLYYSFYSGYVIFQDNPPKQRQKPDPQKVNTNISKKPLAKANATLQNRNLKTKNQTIKKKDAIVRNLLLKDTVKQKPIRFPNTGSNYPDQNISTLSGTQNQKRTAENKGLNDSAQTVNTKQASQPTRVNTEVSLIDSPKVVTASRNTDSITANQSSPTTSTNKSRRKNNKNGAAFHYGIQWNVNIPVYGFNEYFTGTNAKNQPYNLLLPGLWVSKIIGKRANELLLLLKPEQQYFTGSKVVATFTGSFSVQDSTLIRRNTVLIKTNSVYVGLQYNYHLSTKWNIGGGLNFNWQYAALINQQTTRLSSGVLLTDSLYGIKKSSQDWKYFKSSFISARLGVSYNLKTFEIGCDAHMPITSIFAGSVSTSRPVNGHIFIRWRIN